MLYIFNVPSGKAIEIIQKNKLLGEKPLFISGVEMFFKAYIKDDICRKNDCLVVEDIPPFAKFGEEGEEIGLRIARYVKKFLSRKENVIFINPAPITIENYGFLAYSILSKMNYFCWTECLK